MTMVRGVLGGVMVLLLSGCGDVELSRPKSRQMEPDRKKTQTRASSPPRPATPRTATSTPTASSNMDASEAVRLLQDANIHGQSVDQAVAVIKKDADQARSIGRRLVQSAQPALRARGAKLLGHVGQPAMDGSKLENLLVSDASDEVKRAAAEGLGQMGAYRSIPALIEAMTSDRLEIRRAAHEAITLMSGFRHPFTPDGSAQTRDRQVFKFRDTVMTIRGRAAATYKKKHGKFAY